MKRIAVIGCPGSGKSTLALKLAIAPLSIRSILLEAQMGTN